MRIQELETKLFVYLHKEPIHIGGSAIGHVTLTIGKANCMAKGIIELLKVEAGEPYKASETEEVTFAQKTWLLTLEE